MKLLGNISITFFSLAVTLGLSSFVYATVGTHKFDDVEIFQIDEFLVLTRICFIILSFILFCLGFVGFIVSCFNVPMLHLINIAIWFLYLVLCIIFIGLSLVTTFLMEDSFNEVWIEDSNENIRHSIEANYACCDYKSYESEECWCVYVNLPYNGVEEKCLTCEDAYYDPLRITMYVYTGLVGLFLVYIVIVCIIDLFSFRAKRKKMSKYETLN